MKIATYNLCFGGNVKQRIHWNKLLEDVNPDIYLMQETCPPEQYVSSEFWSKYQNQAVWSQVGENAWGCAILVRSGLVKEIKALQFDGTLVGVEVEKFAWAPLQNRPLRIFSIHADKSYKSYKTHVNQTLDWIATLPGEADLMIGGDFNLTVGVRHPTEPRHELEKDSDLWLLDRLRKEFGLISCWQAANPNRDLAQTLRCPPDRTRHFHCDGIFVPAAWYRYLDKCEVLTSPVWEELSDHNPVVATFSD